MAEEGSIHRDATHPGPQKRKLGLKKAAKSRESVLTGSNASYTTNRIQLKNRVRGLVLLVRPARKREGQDIWAQRRKVTTNR